MEAVGGR